MFYDFRQNNSGGVFYGHMYVVVEASSHKEANEIAETHTEVYFDGCDSGQDCSCCGDRWSRKSSYSKGEPEPHVYGKPIREFLQSKTIFFDRTDGIIVRYRDGREEEFK